MARDRVTVTLSASFLTDAEALAVPAMSAAAEVVAEGQRRRIPVSRDGSYGRQPGYARSRIHVETGTDAQGPYWDVGSDATAPDGTAYPVILELGSVAHEIHSHGDYPLRDQYGHIFGRTVHHPGTKPYPWCRAALADIVGRVF